MKTFDQQIADIKAKPVIKKPNRKRFKPNPEHAIMRYERSRIRWGAKDVNLTQIALMVIKGIPITVICTLTKKDVTERIILSAMNAYLYSYTGNLSKYIEILKTSVLQ